MKPTLSQGSEGERDRVQLQLTMPSVRFFIFLLLTLAFSSSIQPIFALRKMLTREISGAEFSDRRSSPSISGSCWDEINEVDGCQDEIYSSLKSNEIEVSYECCRVITQGKCTDVLSSGGEFSPEFGGAVNEYCDGLGITPPLVGAEEKRWDGVEMTNQNQ